MKKVIVLVLCFVFIITGCGSRNKNIDLKKIESDLLSSKYFSNHEVISKDTFEKKYDLNLGNEDLLVVMSKKYDDATMILIIKNSSGIKKSIDDFVDSYNGQWVKMNYFPEQKELVEKAMYKITKDYIVYIVSENNEDVLKMVNI